MAVTPVETWNHLEISGELQEVLNRARSITLPRSREELVELALGGDGAKSYELAYEVPGKGRVVEANIVRARNGVVVNYTEPYMRRRDPDCMVIADDAPTDKTRYAEWFKDPFPSLRRSVLDWLGEQDLILLPFTAGSSTLGYPALLVAPLNASFFAAGLADLQGFIPAEELPEGFAPRAILYLAPPFRHTHCGGKQVVIHNRQQGLHELFSLNLYPGPSAKKGIYGVLLNIGEEEGWLTAHGATVQVVTPYDNVVTILHEGASGSGKSEMLEYPHRESDGRLLLGENTVTGERRHLVLTQGCILNPVTDDMALCHPSFQKGGRRLVVSDAEQGWFVRINHITHYGSDPHLERLCIHPPEPLMFLSLYGEADTTCLIWEHTEDAPGKPCPNPRVILPRRIIPNIVNKPVKVDIRSFGIRTPPCTRENPTYGIMGLCHFLPPALAWLWRLAAPRGHDNPSILDQGGMSSEGVGSYWPFATGRQVDQANLQLKLIQETPGTRYTLSPNQHVGAWNVGFIPQWLTREYLSRRAGSTVRPDQVRPSRCALLGYALYSLEIEGVQIPRWFLQVNTQPEVGDEAFDIGAEALNAFFRQELAPYLKAADLDPLGRRIIGCLMDGGSVQDYQDLLPLDNIIDEE